MEELTIVIVRGTLAVKLAIISLGFWTGVCRRYIVACATASSYAVTFVIVAGIYVVRTPANITYCSVPTPVQVKVKVNAYFFLTFIQYSNTQSRRVSFCFEWSRLPYVRSCKHLGNTLDSGFKNKDLQIKKGGCNNRETKWCITEILLCPYKYRMFDYA